MGFSRVEKNGGPDPKVTEGGEDAFVTKLINSRMTTNSDD